MLEDGERSIHQRGNIKASFSGTAIKSISDSGTVYLTNLRIIFKPKSRRRNSRFWEENGGIMSLKLADIFKEKFNQPLFGANNMTGRCAISPSQVTGHEIYWKLSFYSGGISTFLMAITRLLKDIRRQRVLSDGVRADE